ncbi:HAD family hydrolase [Agromyces sp. NPDC058484]|uniref:HAD family hydrolase n=1 Tax=Agromyces sp. NPDC058484 TaxID=3346524 RepID=UPI003661AED9
MPATPVVLFDLDDTLMAHREAVATGIVHHMRSRAYFGDEAEAARRWHELEEEHYLAYLGGALTFEGQRHARAVAFARLFGEELDDGAASRWFAEYFDRYQESWALHDDVVPALDALAEAIPGVRFGIITNGELEYQTAKVARLALDGRIDQVIASGAVGAAKPDSAIFRAALDRFEAIAPVSAAAYVGDRLRTDAIGAADAGLVGVWLNRRNDPVSSDDTAAARAAGVLEIRGLGELPALLAARWAP